MPPNILQQIVEHKRRELVSLQQSRPVPDFAQGPRKRRRLSVEVLLDTLLQRRIIAEIKCNSESGSMDKIDWARAYETGGAAMLSIPTDEQYLSGSFALLEEIGRAVNCPLLCQDFIVDEWQLDAADSAGADAVLLLVGCFEPESEQLQHLYNYALAKGLVPLVEISGPQERYDAYRLKPYLLGVRDWNNMEMAISTLGLLYDELSMHQARAARAHAGLPELPLFIGPDGTEARTCLEPPSDISGSILGRA